MNSISAWNIFCQSMLANIDGETDYPELDYQFDQFLFCYSNNQRLYLEMAPSLTLYKLANGYEDKEFYGKFLNEIEDIESLGFISAKVELIISFYWKLYDQEDYDIETSNSTKLDQSLLDNLNCTFEQFISYIRATLENKDVKLSDKLKVIQLIKTVDDSMINSSSYIITYPNGSKRVYRTDESIDDELMEFINKIENDSNNFKILTSLEIFLNNLKDVYFKEYVNINNLDTKEFLKWFDFFYKNYQVNYLKLLELSKNNIHINFLLAYNCF